MFRRMGRSSWDRHRGKLSALLFFLVVIIILKTIDLQIRPVITTMSLYQGKIIATQVINEVMERELSRNIEQNSNSQVSQNDSLDYSQLVVISRNMENEITSLQINMLQANRLKSRVTSEILKELAQVGEKEMKIPIGTFLSSEFFFGRGPKVRFKLIPSGYVEAQFENHFSSAGINQTLHQITLKITTRVTTIIPGYTSAADVSTDFIVAQTLINGAVPDAYLDSEKGILSLSGS